MAKKEKLNEVLEGEEEIVRARLPNEKEGEVLGIIESRLGFGRLNVICADKKIRVCRVPGKYRKRLWLREGDVVIVKKWQIQGDERGDVIYKYRKAEVAWLEREGYLKDLTI